MFTFYRGFQLNDSWNGEEGINKSLVILSLFIHILIIPKQTFSVVFLVFFFLLPAKNRMKAVSKMEKEWEVKIIGNETLLLYSHSQANINFFYLSFYITTRKQEAGS